MLHSARAWVFITLQSLIIIFVGHLLGGKQGLLWGLAASLSINIFLYFYGDRRLLNHFKGQELEGQDSWGALNITGQLSQKARLPMPKIYILPADSPQAVAIGHNWKQSSILLTTGLLESLNKSELTAVLAYQIVSIQSLSTLPLSFGSLFAEFLLKISTFFDMLLREITGLKKDIYTPYSSPFTSLISPFIYFILKYPIGKSIFYTLDKKAAQLLDNPHLLAEVLWKLDSYSTTLPLKTPASTAPLFMVNPLTKKGWTRYFCLQPSAQQRIQKLIGYYPI